MISDSHNADVVAPFFKSKGWMKWIAFPRCGFLSCEILNRGRQFLESLPETPVRLAVTAVLPCGQREDRPELHPERSGAVRLHRNLHRSADPKPRDLARAGTRPVPRTLSAKVNQRQF